MDGSLRSFDSESGPARDQWQASEASDSSQAFDPPADYQFEPEFLPPIPRPIPQRVRQGRHEQMRVRSGWILLAFGLLAVTLDELPGIQQWVNFFPPLAYLQWLGVGAIAFFAWGAVFGSFIRFRWGPYRYVRYGLPLVARVDELVKTPELVVHGQVTHYAITALIRYRDPHTGEIRSREVKSPSFSARSKDDYTTSFRVGDYVTAVYLPGKFPKSLRLFGFLDLVPGLGILRTRPIWAKSAIARIVFRSTMLFALLAILVSGLFAFRFYRPIAMDWRDGILPVFVGIVGFATVHVATTRYLARERQRVAERNAQALASGEALEVAPTTPKRSGVRDYAIAIFVFAGGMLLGGFTVLCWCFAANAWLDGSPPVFKPAEIERVKTWTYEWIFREYIVEYSLQGVEDRQEYSTSAENAWQFTRAKTASAEVHAGRFGWHWVKRLEPAAPAK